MGLLLTALVIVFTFMLILAVILGMGVGVGYAVNWLFPAIDLSAGVLAGLIGGLAAAYLTARFFWAAWTYNPDADEEIEEGDEPLRPPIFIIEPPTLRRKKRRRPS